MKFAVAVAGVLIFGLACYYGGREFYKPGALSTPHAQILAARLATDACAACHPQAGASPLQWILSGHESVSALQSDRCMDCHHTRLPRQYARTAHNLSPAQLQRLSHAAQQVTRVGLGPDLSRPPFPVEDVACAACHREHAGADAKLTALSDAQCQTCHSNRYTSFASDHPSWGDWPYSRKETLSFDHQSHSQRHFSSKRDADGSTTSFDCMRCHTATESGDFSRISSYATACGTCHDPSLEQQTSERLDLFVVPSLIEPDPSVVDAWPAAATGFYDGQIGPLSRLLLAKQSEHQAAMKLLPGEADFTRIQPGDRAQHQAAQTIAVAVRGWIGAMATQGPIPATANVQVEHPALRGILRGLPPQLVSDTFQRWFGGSPPLVSHPMGDHARNPVRPAALRRLSDPDQLLSDDGNDPLLDGLATEDPLLEAMGRDPLDDQPPRPKRGPGLPEHDPLTMQPDGGWYVDDSRMAISYRGHGHADPVIRAAIELAVGLPAESSIRKDLLVSTPVAACIRCHPGADTMGAIAWRPAANDGDVEDQFTAFSHKPHMNLPVMTDCKHCHAISGEVAAASDSMAMTSVSLMQRSSFDPPHDFLPITREACASCHTQAAAGDACIQCHRYHSNSAVTP
ncbi:MAG: cytochrome c3 family protein [Planctomycetaceae bacterium]